MMGQGRRAARGRTLAAALAALALLPAMAWAQADDPVRLAFVDPELSAAAAGENPLALSLEQGLARYQARWGGLPAVKIPAGAAMGAGAVGPRVALLRQRLGVRGAGAVFDPALGKAVADFQRDHGLPASGVADEATVAALNAGPRQYEQLITANLQRARALPPALGERYILVNAAEGRLWLYEHGAVVKTMKVVVGKPALPTPMMAGLIRVATFNPYWNVPADLVKDSIAPRVLKEGIGYLQDQGMEVLSDYGEHAVVLEPAKVDWTAVASGAAEVRVRQKPGPKNMMGQVKLAFPNPLGIYLHDTPLRDLFGLDQRTASSGCVRLEDAAALADLLLGQSAARAARASGELERQAALPVPVPVYITYLTAEPQGEGFVFRPDVYGRDKTWVAQQTAALAAAGAAGGH